MANTNETDPLVCQVTLFGIEYESNIMNRVGSSTTQKEWFTVCNLVRDDGRVTSHMYDVSLPDDVLQQYRPLLLQGQDVYVSLTNAQLSPETDSILLSDATIVTASTDPPPWNGGGSRHHVRQRQLSQPTTEGTLTLLILRIVATDAEPDVSASDLYYYTFESEVSLQSQLELCSFQQLHIEPARLGVVNVPIQLSASGTNYKTLVNAGYTAALQQLLNANTISSDTSDIRELADLVMVVLPPGTGTWKGFAAVGGQQSVFNNEWASYVGATSHEIGHNLGLHHAFQNMIEYADVTGYMGGAVKQTNYPQKCYNAQNHWHLGWYASRALEVDPRYPAIYTVIPFVDYPLASDHQYVLIRIMDDLEVYLQYNRHKLFNVDTGLYPDRLTIVHDFGEGTNLLAGLDLSTQPWYQQTIDSTKTLTIEICSSTVSSSSSQPDVMQVSIGYGSSLCPYSTAPTTSSVTFTSRSNAIVNQFFFPVAMASGLVVVVVSLTALFLRAFPLRKRTKQLPAASDVDHKVPPAIPATSASNISSNNRSSHQPTNPNRTSGRGRRTAPDAVSYDLSTTGSIDTWALSSTVCCPDWISSPSSVVVTNTNLDRTTNRSIFFPPITTTSTTATSEATATTATPVNPPFRFWF